MLMPRACCTHSAEQPWRIREIISDVHSPCTSVSACLPGQHTNSHTPTYPGAKTLPLAEHMDNRTFKKFEEESEGVRDGKTGSVIAEKYAAGQWKPKPGATPPDKYPTNEEVTKAVQQRLAESVETYRKYRHVAWYTLFVAMYMLVLYFQANTYRAGEVVRTLKKALLPADGSNTMSFSSENDVLAYLGTHIVQPIWKDPVCGDGKCEYPWEFPAFGRFGCQADCGVQPNTTNVVVTVNADFTGHPTISPRVLMSNAVWNLCLKDPDRTKRGEADLCWFADDQTFSASQETQIQSMNLIDGNWYISVKGDYAGRVAGAVYNFDNATDPQPLSLMPAWDTCKYSKKRKASAATVAVRRLLAAYTQAKSIGDEASKAALHGVIKEVSESLKQAASQQHTVAGETQHGEL